MEEERHVFKSIDSIHFGVMSPKLIKKLSAAKVVTSELYDKEGYPVDSGLMDTKMGVIDPGLRCRTCSNKLKECTGHFGHIELARPIIHINYVNLVLTLLRGTCNECSRILLSTSDIELWNQKILTAEQERGVEGRKMIVKQILDEVKKGTKCPHCKAKQKKVTLEKPTTFLENDKRVTPIEIRTRFEKISDEDIVLFGMNPANVRPEWLVLTMLLIPPVTMRPSITLETGERSEDDLTHKLGDIVRINQRLFENINAGAPEIIIEDLWDLLQYHVTTFFDNEVAQLPPARHRSGQPLKTLAVRLKSKEGRIRHNLAGKRTNFSARTVISPDPLLEINEIGVPFEIAKKLTVPERITEWNQKYLREFVEKGPDTYPGSNYIVRPDGKKKKITDETKEQLLEEMQPGYTVERHLMDGDVAIFNRQPSLHRMSMMCHKVRVLPGKTFRLNPAVCHPYNADFDGDEMNLHIPQTEEARAEAETLMQVQTQLISPAFGLSVIGSTQDALTGAYLLSKEKTIPRSKAVDMLYNIGAENYKNLKGDTVSGLDIFSCILPDDFDYKDENITIKKGVFVEGILDKKSLGQGRGYLLRSIHKKYGPDRTLVILGQMFRLGIENLIRRGFTTGIQDSDVALDIRSQIESVKEKAYKDIDSMITKLNKKDFEVLPGKSMNETFELRVLELLNKVRDETGKLIQENAKANNSTVIMSTSGARGNPLNMAQMAGCVGQQAFRGGRIDKGYNDRTLSCFAENDLKPAARGFIRNSFKQGLTPSEFFFGAMTGRDALMDTALRTPKSGYLYRRLANAMQDVRLGHDNTVRDSTNRIIQFKYGEDGVDVSKSEGGTLNVKRIINQVLEK